MNRLVAAGCKLAMTPAAEEKRSSLAKGLPFCKNTPTIGTFADAGESMEVKKRIGRCNIGKTGLPKPCLQTACRTRVRSQKPWQPRRFKSRT